MRRLNQLRLDAGYSIADVARLMQVDENVVCGWLSGKEVPPPEQRQELARILRVSPDALDDAPAVPRPVSLRDHISASFSRLRSQNPGSRGSARL